MHYDPPELDVTAGSSSGGSEGPAHAEAPAEVAAPGGASGAGKGDAKDDFTVAKGELSEIRGSFSGAKGEASDEATSEAAGVASAGPEVGLGEALARAASTTAADVYVSRGMFQDDWEGRLLCIDGACNGVVTYGGTCGTCGKPHPDFRKPAPQPMPGRDRVLPTELGTLGETAAREGEEHRGEVDGDEEQAHEGGEEGGWEERKLCDDGACIGVVIDGRCDTCGRASA